MFFVSPQLVTCHSFLSSISSLPQSHSGYSPSEVPACYHFCSRKWYALNTLEMADRGSSGRFHTLHGLSLQGQPAFHMPNDRASSRTAVVRPPRLTLWNPSKPARPPRAQPGPPSPLARWRQAGHQKSHVRSISASELPPNPVEVCRRRMKMHYLRA